MELQKENQAPAEIIISKKPPKVYIPKVPKNSELSLNDIHPEEIARQMT